MCGIAGQVAFDERRVADGWLSHACELLAHRGPDRQQIWNIGRVGLGHRRLRIIDLDASADQPMHNSGCVSAGRASPLTVVFNGEIYNHRELRRDLLTRGHCLQTESDTEAILHLYEEEGARCVERLRGMFAFAVWDQRKAELFIARDRLGKKPLYWRHAGNTFWFASEPRAILADPDVPVAVNLEAIASYLRLGFVPSPESAIAGLRRLSPAHRATVSAAGISIERYWSLDYRHPLRLKETEALEQLRARLQESVRLRLLSDVPLGALLSGGVDSSTIVALMAREGPVRTFSIGFDDESFDELPYARAVARHLSTDHHELRVRPAVADLLPKLAWHYGEPFGDSSAVPTYYVSQMARRHVTVALNGDGGDEAFGGYRRYRAEALVDRLARLPGLVRGGLQLAARVLPAATRAKSRLYDVERLVSSVGATDADRYAGWLGFFSNVSQVVTDDFASATARDGVEPLRAAFARYQDLSPPQVAMAVDVALYLPDDLLVKADIAAMAHGLEARSPLLDHEVMEFAARLPIEFKIRHGQGKYLLRKLAEPLLPPGVLNRPKAGFAVPLDRWLRTDLAPVLRDVLLSRRSVERGILDVRSVRTLLDEHFASRRSHAHRVWALLMLEFWYRECIDAVPALRRTVSAADSRAV